MEIDKCKGCKHIDLNARCFMCSRNYKDEYKKQETIETEKELIERYKKLKKFLSNIGADNQYFDALDDIYVKCKDMFESDETE